MDSTIIKDRVNFGEAVTLKKRTCYSISHIQAAAIFARASAKMEEAVGSKTSDAKIQEHRAYVTGSVLAAVYFLEAKINELFADAVDNPTEIKQMNSGVITSMASIWRFLLSGRYVPVLDKYQVVLSLAGKALFDKGKSPYLDVSLLVRLRNTLVHYKPEWVTTISEHDPLSVTVQEFEKMLQGKFSLNPFFGERDTFFPDRCMSHGCAQWAVVSSLQFADEFFSRLGVTPQYDHIRPSLGTT